MPAKLDDNPAPSKHLDLKYWWCGGKTGCGHIVGEIARRELQKGGTVKVLNVYEQSLDVAPTEAPLVRGQVVSCFGFRCTKCGNLYDWYPSLESLNRIVMNYRKGRP